MTLQNEARQDALKLALDHVKPLDVENNGVTRWLNAVGFVADYFLAYAETSGQPSVGFHHGADKT